MRSKASILAFRIIRYLKTNFEAVVIVCVQLSLDEYLALLGKLQGIACQIGKYLPQPGGVAHQTRGNIGGQKGDQLQPLLLRLNGDTAAYILYQGSQVKGDTFLYPLCCR